MARPKRTPRARRHRKGSKDRTAPMVISSLDSVSFEAVPYDRPFRVVVSRDCCRSPMTVARQFVAFELWQPAEVLASLAAGKSKFRPFDPVQSAVSVAAMVRHAADEAARAGGRDKKWINTFIHGHTPDGKDRLRGGPDTARFAYLPLPSLERRGPKGERRTEYCGSIRRVLIVGPPGMTAELDWVGRALSGRELVDPGTKKPVALLSLISKKNPHLQSYINPASVWSTVTPVVLPGHDEGNRAKARQLLCRAFAHAGVSPELIERVRLEWRLVGFRPGVELATRYQRPEQLRFPRLHVWVRWPKPIRGPLAAGAGRYRGLGIFASE